MHRGSCARAVELLPGAEAWVERLHVAECQAWRTSAPRANVDTILEVSAVGGFFGAAITAEDVTHGKPDPSLFRWRPANWLRRPTAASWSKMRQPADPGGVQPADALNFGVGPRHASLPAGSRDCAVAGCTGDYAFEWVVEAGS